MLERLAQKVTKQPSEYDGRSGMQLQRTMSAIAAHSWDNAPETLGLPLGEVHIWRAHLPQQNDGMPELRSLLSEEESRRATQFRFPEDSHRYVFAHGVLRDILLRYRTIVNTPLTILPGSKGRPEIFQESSASRLKFNLSHSHSLVLVAVALNWQIGVDIEHLSQGADWQTIAKHCFSASECRELFAAPEPERIKIFLTQWTRKEAYVKARGEGLSMPLASFSILPSPDGTLKVDDSSEPTATSAWSFHDLLPDDDYVGALAVDGFAQRLQNWDWNTIRAGVSP